MGKRYGIALLAVFALGSLLSGQQTSGAGAMAAKADAMVLNQMHAMNLMLMRAGRMAETKAETGDVQRYGRRLALDHRFAEKRVAAMAAQLQVALKPPPTASANGAPAAATAPGNGTPPPGGQPGAAASNPAQPSGAGGMMAEMKMQAMQQHAGESMNKMMAGMQTLATMHGRDFDPQFLAMMQQGNQNAIQMLSQAEPMVSPRLRSLLSHLLPILKQHEQIAQNLMKAQG